MLNKKEGEMKGLRNIILVFVLAFGVSGCAMMEMFTDSQHEMVTLKDLPFSYIRVKPEVKCSEELLKKEGIDIKNLPQDEETLLKAGRIYRRCMNFDMALKIFDSITQKPNNFFTTRPRSYYYFEIAKVYLAKEGLFRKTVPTGLFYEPSIISKLESDQKRLEREVPPEKKQLEIKQLEKKQNENLSESEKWLNKFLDLSRGIEGLQSKRAEAMFWEAKKTGNKVLLIESLKEKPSKMAYGLLAELESRDITSPRMKCEDLLSPSTFLEKMSLVKKYCNMATVQSPLSSSETISTLEDSFYLDVFPTKFCNEGNLITVEQIAKEKTEKIADIKGRTDINSIIQVCKTDKGRPCSSAYHAVGDAVTESIAQGVYVSYNKIEDERNLWKRYYRGEKPTYIYRGVQLPVAISQELITQANNRGFKTSMNLDLPFYVWLQNDIFDILMELFAPGKKVEPMHGLCYLTDLLGEGDFETINTLINGFLNHLSDKRKEKKR